MTPDPYLIPHPSCAVLIDPTRIRIVKYRSHYEMVDNSAAFLPIAGVLKDYCISIQCISIQGLEHCEFPPQAAIVSV